jgi:hypothetical protein
MNQTFGIQPRIWIQKKSNFGNTKWDFRVNTLKNLPKNRCVGLFYPKICGIILHSILGNFADGKNKQITTEIKNSHKLFLVHMIRAFFDSEASAYNKRNMIRVFQDNKDILEEIRNILFSFDIKTNNVKYYIKKYKKRYYFDITNKENFLKFHKVIGFNSNYKKLNS